MRSWGEYYGEEMLTQIARMWKCGEGLRALPDMLTLLIYAPQYFAKCSYKPVKKAGYGLLKAILPVSVRRRLLQWLSTTTRLSGTYNSEYCAV